jgi:hypothetical protein
VPVQGGPVHGPAHPQQPAELERVDDQGHPVDGQERPAAPA